MNNRTLLLLAVLGIGAWWLLTRKTQGGMTTTTASFSPSSGLPASSGLDGGGGDNSSNSFNSQPTQRMAAPEVFPTYSGAISYPGSIPSVLPSPATLNPQRTADQLCSTLLPM